MNIYSAGIVGLAPVASATDIFEIRANNKTVRVLHLTASGIATAVGAHSMQLVKRSTANTGGTSTSPAAVPHDSISPAASAVLKAYTANSTLGALVGPIRAKRITVATATLNVIPSTQAEFDLRDMPIYLRGAAETLALNLNGVTITGCALDIQITWVEE